MKSKSCYLDKFYIYIYNIEKIDRIMKGEFWCLRDFFEVVVPRGYEFIYGNKGVERRWMVLIFTLMFLIGLGVINWIFASNDFDRNFLR